MRDYQICISCVMDATESRMAFDENGVCNPRRVFWKNIKPYWHADEHGRNVLVHIVEKAKSNGKHRNFDCVMGLNDGMDGSCMFHGDGHSRKGCVDLVRKVKAREKLKEALSLDKEKFVATYHEKIFVNRRQLLFDRERLNSDLKRFACLSRDVDQKVIRAFLQEIINRGQGD